MDATCSNDTTTMLGRVRVPLPTGETAKVPFEALLPRSGAPIDPASGLPEGLVVEVGPYPVDIILGRNSSGGRRQLVELVVALRGPAEAACDGATKGTSLHAYLTAWMADTELTDLLRGALGPNIEQFEALRLFRELQVMFVRHIAPSPEATPRVLAIGGNPREVSIPRRFRGLFQAMHIRATMHLQSGSTHDLMCMGAWLVSGVHPCVERDVHMEAFVPLFDDEGRKRDTESTLEDSYVVSPLGVFTASRPTFLASGSVEFLLDDLRSSQYTPWGDKTTQQVALHFTDLTIRLPVRADLTAWAEVRFAAARSRVMRETLPSDDVWLNATMAEAPATNRVQEYIVVVAEGPLPAWTPLTYRGGWSAPLGTDFVLEDVQIGYYYTLLHPQPSLVGPGVLHAVGVHVLSSGEKLRVGVQLDKQLGQAEPGVLLNNGAYVASDAAIDGFAAIETYLRVVSASEWLQRSDLPSGLSYIFIDPFYACFAEGPVRFEGPVHSGFRHRECQPGFHLASHGTAWGVASRVYMDAEVAAVGANFSLSTMLMKVALVTPDELSPAVVAGIDQAVGQASFAHSHGQVTEAEVNVRVEPASKDTAASAQTALAIVAEYAHNEFDISARLQIGEMNAAGGAQLQAFVSNVISASWPSNVAIAIGASSTNVYALVELYLSMYPQALEAPPAIPEVFKYVRLVAASGCFAGRHVAGYCHAGVHTALNISISDGLLGAEAEAFITAQATVGSSSTSLGPLVVDLVVRFDSLEQLLPFVRNGLLGALSRTVAQGAPRYFAESYLVTARLHYSSDPNDAAQSSLIMELGSHLHCEVGVITIALSEFEPLVWQKERLAGAHVERVLSDMPIQQLLGFFAKTSVLDFDFVAATDLPAWAARRDNQGATLTSFMESFSVCHLGMYVSYLEQNPLPTAPELCEASLLWMDRMSELHVARARDAACGRQPASSEVAQLLAFEARLRELAPARWMGPCLQLRDLIVGVRTTTERPAAALGKHLLEVQGMLQTLENIWASVGAREPGATPAVQGGAPRETDPEELAAEMDAANAQIREMLPYLTSKLATMVQWRPTANRIAQSLHSIYGVMSASDVDLLSVDHLQRWSVALRDVVGRLEGGMPQVVDTLVFLKQEFTNMLPKVAKVVATTAGVGETVSQVQLTLIAMREVTDSLSPEDAFFAMYRLRELETLNYTILEVLYDHSKEFIDLTVDWLEKSPPHMKTFSPPAEALIPAFKTKNDEVNEMLRLKSGGMTDMLHKFTSKLGEMAPSLLEELVAKAKILDECALVVEEASKELPYYLESVNMMLATDGPFELVDKSSTLFSERMTRIMDNSRGMLSNIATLKGGRQMALDLQNASRHFTPELYVHLIKESTSLIRYFINFGPRVITKTFLGYLTYADSLLRPAIVQIENVINTYLVQDYWDHLRSLAVDLLAKLDALSGSARASWLPPELSASSGPGVEAAVDHAFESIIGMQSELVELLSPESTCLDDADCQSDMQVKVNAMRKRVRELTHALRPLPSLTASLVPNLLSTFNLPDFASELLPDLAVLSMWTRTLRGSVPENTALGSSSIVQQFARCMCKELKLREGQGRDATPPSWFKLKCGSVSDLDGGLVDSNDNPFEDGVATASEMSDLFEYKMTEVVHNFDDHFYNMTVNMVEQVESADGASRDFDAVATRFVETFNALLASFKVAEKYFDAMPTVAVLQHGVRSSADFPCLHA